MGGYKYLSHTADIKIEAWGKDLEEAFIEAGKALEDAAIDINRVEPRQKVEFEIGGDDLEELLYNFLEELIIKIDVDRMVFSNFEVEIRERDGRYMLKCRAYGEKLDMDKHRPKIHIKAATYHEMEIINRDGGVVIRYVLDI